MTTGAAVVLLLRRVRLLALLAALAWLAGIYPPLLVRLVLVVAVAVALVLDVLADRGAGPGPVRITGYGRPGGEDG
jgi:hypothetical protein